MRVPWHPGWQPVAVHPTGTFKHASRVVDKGSDRGARVQDFLDRRLPWVAGAVAIGVALSEIVTAGIVPRSWDWMAISGTATLFVGLALARSFRPMFERTLERMCASGSFVESEPGQLDQWFKERLAKWSHRTGLVMSVTIAPAFIAAYGLSTVQHEVMVLLFTVASVVGAYLVGRYVGQAMLYGRLHHACKETRVKLELQPGHLDGAAGWRPLGQLYFRQALLLAIPAVHLGLWWFLIPVVGDYEKWRDPYAWLLAMVILWEVAAFVGPMWAFHTEMGREKRKLLAQADQAGQRVSRIKSQVAWEEDSAKRAAMHEHVAALTEHHRMLEHLPTWPVDAGTRRKFTVNHLLLAVPLVASWIEQGSVSWSGIESVLGSWLG